MIKPCDCSKTNANSAMKIEYISTCKNGLNITESKDQGSMEYPILQKNRVHEGKATHCSRIQMYEISQCGDKSFPILHSQSNFEKEIPVSGK